MRFTQLIAVSVLSCVSFTASSGNWYDKYDRSHKHSLKQNTEYWDGNCQVKRKVKKDGSYKEKRECKGPSHGRNFRSNDNYYRGQRNEAIDLLPAIIEPFIRAMN